MDNTGLIINFDDFNGPNPHRFLSNFYIGYPIRVFGEYWMTGEHAYQAMKSPWTSVRDRIRSADDPGLSKSWGRNIELRSDWEAVKYDVMAAVLRAKFTMDRDEGQLLLDTGEALLVEGTSWGDDIWGVKGRELTEYALPPSQVTSPGRNWLGTLLMARRAELVAEFKFGIVHDTGTYNAAFGK